MSSWPPSDTICAVAMPLIKRFEGFSATPYLDAAGIPTIGHGTTCYPDGRKVAMTDSPVDEGTADMLVECHLDHILDVIKTPGVLTRAPVVNQAAAFLSLTYNIGVNAFAGSTVASKFDAGDDAAAAQAFLMWNKAHVNGEVVELAGLTARRQAEKELFEGMT